MFWTQVARHELYLKIATEDEYDKSFLDKIKAQEGSTFGTVTALHVTVHPLSWWMEQFLKYSTFSCWTNAYASAALLKCNCYLHCTRINQRFNSALPYQLPGRDISTFLDNFKAHDPEYQNWCAQALRRGSRLGEKVNPTPV